MGSPPEATLHPTRHKSAKINTAHLTGLAVYEIQKHQGYEDYNCAFGHEAHETRNSLFLDFRIHFTVFVFLVSHSDNSVVCFALPSLQRRNCHARRYAQRQKSACRASLIDDPAIGAVLMQAAGHLARMP